MPSGSSTLACRYSSKRCPLITSTTRPSTSRPIEYCHSDPGWNISGRAASWSQIPSRSVSSGTPHSKPAWRYNASTGWAYMNPYVSPAVWLNSCHSCIGSTCGSSTGRCEEPARHTLVSANAGRYLATGSLSSKRPCSHSVSAATAVIGLVIEYTRQIVSRSTGAAAATSRIPAVDRWAILP